MRKNINCFFEIAEIIYVLEESTNSKIQITLNNINLVLNFIRIQNKEEKIITYDLSLTDAILTTIPIHTWIKLVVQSINKAFE